MTLFARAGLPVFWHVIGSREVERLISRFMTGDLWSGGDTRVNSDGMCWFRG